MTRVPPSISTPPSSPRTEALCSSLGVRERARGRHSGLVVVAQRSGCSQ